MENDVVKKMGEAISTEFAKEKVPATKRYELMRKLQNEDNISNRKHYLEYLKNKKDVVEIYNLIRNKKFSKNQIRTKIKEFLKNEDDINEFLHSILDSKKYTKKENKEATSAGGSSGAFEPLLTGSNEKINTKEVPTVREGTEKVETKEATSSSSSGQFNQPAIWAKSMNKRDWKGASTKYMPGAKRVQVKKRCKKFPYCNQGDIRALKIFESESVQNAIDSVSSNYGFNKKYISEIVFREIRKRQK